MGLQTDVDFQWFVSIDNKACGNELRFLVSAAVIQVKEKSLELFWLTWKTKFGSVRLAQLRKEGPKTQDFLEVNLLLNLHETFLF